jgi:hypothetical protein
MEKWGEMMQQLVSYDDSVVHFIHFPRTVKTTACRGILAIGPSLTFRVEGGCKYK